MLFQEELTVSEVLKETWHVLKENLNLVLAYGIIFYLLRIGMVGYEYLKVQRLIGDMDLSSIGVSRQMLEKQLQFMGIDMGVSLVFILASSLLASYFILKFAQHYFDDERTTGELLGYVFPRIFKFGAASFLVMLMVLIPATIVLGIVVFSTMSVESELIMQGATGLLGILLVPFAMVCSFIQFKILIDDAPFFDSIKAGFKMTFGHLGRIYMFLFVISVLLGLSVGINWGISNYVSDHLMIRFALELPASFISIFAAIAYLVFYLDLDYRCNQEEYTLIEEI